MSDVSSVQPIVINISSSRADSQARANRLEIATGWTGFDTQGLAQITWEIVAQEYFVDSAGNKPNDKWTNYFAGELKKANGYVARPYDLASLAGGAAYRLDAWTPAINVKIPSELMPYLKGPDKVECEKAEALPPLEAEEITFEPDATYAGRKIKVIVNLNRLPDTTACFGVQFDDGDVIVGSDWTVDCDSEDIISFYVTVPRLSSGEYAAAIYYGQDNVGDLTGTLKILKPAVKAAPVKPAPKPKVPSFNLNSGSKS